MARGYRISLELEPQSEGEYTVTSPDIPELITEGDTVEEALDNALDAFVAVFELYEKQGRGIPARAETAPEARLKGVAPRCTVPWTRAKGVFNGLYQM